MTDERRTHRFADRFEWVVFVAAGVALVMLFSLAGADRADDTAATADQGPVDEGTTEPSGAAGGADQDGAAELYGRFCSNCHGVDGEGAVGPRLADLEERYPDGSSLPALIANGRGIMPGFVSTMSGDEIAAVADHIRTRFG